MIRAGEPGAPSTIDVYSNLNEITLYVNGVSQSVKKTDDIKKCSWKVYLKEGKNVISASGKQNGKTYRDEVVMDYRTYNHNLSDPRAPFESLAVNAGSNAQYLDRSGNVWIEDRPYSKGSFGYLNGDAKTFDRTEVIKNTGDTPLFYSFLDGIKGYRLDVPDGTYKIELCFAENERLQAGDRVFDVSVNNNPVLENLDLTAMYGFAEAVRKTFIISVKNGEGISISLDAKKGKAILSGIKVERRYVK